MKLEIPGIEYFESKNKFSGSLGNFNYKIIPSDKLEVYLWMGKNCFECSESKELETFELNQNGYQDAVNWITAQFTKRNI